MEGVGHLELQLLNVLLSSCSAMRWYHLPIVGDVVVFVAAATADDGWRKEDKRSEKERIMTAQRYKIESHDSREHGFDQ